MKTGNISEECTQSTVFVVDADIETRNTLKSLIEPMNITVETFANVSSFLQIYSPSIPGCLLLDARLTSISGQELQKYFKRNNILIPIIFLSAQSSVAIAVRSMKAGAVDFLEKPVDDQMLIDSIHRALEIDRENRNEGLRKSLIMERIGILSPREEEVLRKLIQGKSNKIVADEMQLSTKTIETHRAHIMQKLGVNSMAGLMWIAIQSGEYHEIPDQLPFNPPTIGLESFTIN